MRWEELPPVSTALIVSLIFLLHLQAQGRQRNENGEFYVFHNNHEVDAVGDVPWPTGWYRHDIV